MLELRYTGQFKRDLKRENAGPHAADLRRLLTSITDRLCEAKVLPQFNRDHPLKGDWKGCRDCHLKPDLILIYRLSGDALELVRLGSHSELFG